jgi:quercetin dioxygenase-like cupin family protein
MTSKPLPGPGPKHNPAAKVTIAKPGEHFFELAKLDQIKGGPDYSSALGSCVEGQRMMVALMRMPPGTGADPHSHPNEQWVFVLEGTLEFDVAGEVMHATPGVAVYIPGNVLHRSKVVGERDVVFFTVKDTSFGLQGIAAGSSRAPG